MGKKLLEQLLTEEQINEVIAFYLAPNTLNEAVRHFEFIKSRPGLVGLLSRNNVPLHTSEIFLKKRNEYSLITNEEKYGVKYPAQSEVVKEKIKQTNLEKYGVENVFAADEIKNKIKNTLVDRYGVENPGQMSTHNSVMQQTCLEKYGNKNYRNPDKTRCTCLARYNTNYVSQSKEIRHKISITNIKKYGVASFSQTIEFHKKARKIYKYNNETFDSLPELAVYMHSVLNNIPISRNPVRLKYYVDGKTHYYFPDFEIDGKLIEIKGNHFFKEDGTMCNPFDHTQDEKYEAKHQCGLQHNVEFWQESDYKYAIDWFYAEGYNKEDFM